MKVKIDRLEELKELVPCLCQYKKNALFSKSALGITEKDLIVYPDRGPSDIADKTFIYHPVLTIKFSEIVTLVVSKITNNSDLKKYTRLDVFAKSEDNCKIIYVLKKDVKKLNNLCKLAKENGIKTIKNTVDYSLGVY